MVDLPVQAVDADALIFDVGGVFLIPHPEPVAEMLDPHGIVFDRLQIEQAHYAGVVALDGHLGPNDIPGQYLVSFLEALGVHVDHREHAHGLLSQLWSMPERDWWSHHVPGSRDGLRALHEAGHTLAVISNANGRVEQQLRSYGICQVGEGAGTPVRAVIDSHVFGVEKPDPRIFHHVSDLLGLPPERCVYVGDTVRYDVLGARAAGFQPFHFDPYGVCRSTDVHPHLRSVADLGNLLA
ncbi:MAG: HAD family hydrolase [Chloroflexi bacterium]|nr:HAD family hydrolase [Chloroflexota bacterium]